MKPSRPRSNGRLAPSGSSSRRERARIVPNPPSARSVIGDSTPPASIASAIPARMYSVAFPSDMPDAAHAVVSVVRGPRVPSAVDVSAAPMFEIRAVTQNGFSRSGPASKSFAYATSCVRRPPMPVPIEHPIRAASAAMSRSASATACDAAATASWAKRSVFRTDEGDGSGARTGAPRTRRCERRPTALSGCPPRSRRSYCHTG